MRKSERQPDMSETAYQAIFICSCYNFVNLGLLPIIEWVKMRGKIIEPAIR
ncbi:MAG: hypothetical protein HUU07_10900 [Candidatus Brocadia sinica]|nr:hypothetical protein [Candidatus Brocadia sinica]